MDKSAQRRCITLCLVLIAGLSALSGRLVYLQVFDRARYAERAENSYMRKEVIQANRGVLLDRNEEVIAHSIISKSVVIDFNHLHEVSHVAKGVACNQLRRTAEWRQWSPEKRRAKINSKVLSLVNEHKDNPKVLVEEHYDYLVNELARPLGLTQEELKKKIPLTRRGGEKVVYQGLPSELAVRLKELIKDRRIKGVFFREEKRRWYPAPELASHLIGYTNREGKGMTGVEKSLNDYLEGTNGYEIEMRDIRGNVMPSNKESFFPPKNGLNVQLTLDLGLQAICSEELDRGMEEFKGVKGCVVLMDPSTGEILAMSNRPHFNLNIRDKVAENGFNYALQATYEPGSTFKIISSAGALNEGIVTPDTEIFCHWASYRPGRFTVKDHHPYGDLPVWKVLQKSSNIGAYKLGLMLGPDKFFEYAKRFGFGRKTEVQLAGESSGILRNTGNAVDFSTNTYGYGISVTPLQVANAYCAIANGGKLMKPYIVRNVTTNSGDIIAENKPTVENRVLSEQTAEQMRMALKSVIETGGTATRAAVPGYTAGGKTGTAKKHDPVNGGYIDGRYTVSFAGMLPAEKPAFVCVVVIDDPQTTEVKRYGGTIAAPIWQRISQRVATHMNLSPTEEISQQLTKN
ncbi:peptidoglycan D,D-transpeptidase FtsI family protein [Rubritalea spongiae]|uniref:Peptidoglycan D,D-transpeptidase FtsI family protein n=1 Tax=Rubritalea spongiae TaxID=430797 RepID=A0ABW5E479_9BACT